MELEWKRHEPLEVNGPAQLDAAFESIESDPNRSAPVLAYLLARDSFLAIGIGYPEVSILMYGSKDRRTPPLHAVPKRSISSTTPTGRLLTFSGYGLPYTFNHSLGLPKDVVRSAALYFLHEGGTLWPGVRWEEEKLPPTDST